MDINTLSPIHHGILKCIKRNNNTFDIDFTYIFSQYEDAYHSNSAETSCTCIGSINDHKIYP